MCFTRGILGQKDVDVERGEAIFVRDKESILIKVMATGQVDDEHRNDD